jgi:hypothetical protein
MQEKDVRVTPFTNVHFFHGQTMPMRVFSSLHENVVNIKVGFVEGV